ncbi:outer membrane protein assembly factor BamE domain-containing protein [Pelomicrobium sp.]|jgi:hypothetical protein|uniref:outer membrane protein assembly factor BamE domain-containing protein n=1 Tax=Pelomicrobium sp. TaxID=2815319 RepID=UPI002FDD18F3
MSHNEWRSLLLAAVLVTLAACGAKVTQENFDKIKAGMTQEEVTALLGEPTESSGFSLGNLSGTSAVWKDRDGAIHIQFVNGKVLSKQFVKGRQEG